MTPRAAVSRVAATAAAACSMSSSTRRVNPCGVWRAIAEWNRKNNWCCRSVRCRIDGRSTATSRSCWRLTWAAGCSRAEERWGQSSGQSISTRRFVAQHTLQIVWPSAGQVRRALRCPQSGQVIPQHTADATIVSLGNLPTKLLCVDFQTNCWFIAVSRWGHQFVALGRRCAGLLRLTDKLQSIKWFIISYLQDLSSPRKRRRSHRLMWAILHIEGYKATYPSAPFALSSGQFDWKPRSPD